MRFKDPALQPRDTQPLLSRLRHPTAPIPLGLWLLNTLVQRFLRINGNVPWMVHFTSRVIAPDRIQIGEKVWVSFAVSGGCYIQGLNGICIGEGSIFAPGVKIISANHDPVDFARWLDADPIQIGRHCWIGANAVILPGVVLGDHSVVGAGAVVTKSFGAESVVAGVPAKYIRENRVAER